MKAGASSFSQKVSIRNRAMIETRSSFSPINFCFSAPIIPGSSSISASRSRISSVRAFRQPCSRAQSFPVLPEGSAFP
jgi:hypothetical protein